MQVVEWLLNHPFILLGSSAAFLGASLLTVIFSRKFRRKFWWGLCCFVSFTWQFQAGDMTIWVALPVGAVFVLAVALFGPRPRLKVRALTTDGSRDAADGWW